MATRWQDLIVTNEGDEMGPLGQMLEIEPANLDGAKLGDDGSIREWMQYYIAAPGEQPDWDTPRGEVDWTGFAEALAAVRGR
jgi:hypothetical protein